MRPERKKEISFRITMWVYLNGMNLLSGSCFQIWVKNFQLTIPSKCIIYFELSVHLSFSMTQVPVRSAMPFTDIIDSLINIEIHYIIFPYILAKRGSIFQSRLILDIRGSTWCALYVVLKETMSHFHSSTFPLTLFDNLSNFAKSVIILT